MPNQKYKSENYKEFGGINSKVSPYVTGPLEFIDLSNLDFQVPGALTHRWGSTMYFGQTFASPPTILTEFTKLSGASYVVIGATAGLWFGATTGQNQGMSFTWFGITAPDGTVTNNVVNVANVEFQFTPAAFRATLINSITPYFYEGNENLAIITFLGIGYQNWKASGNYRNSNSVIFDNYLFYGDGVKMVKFDGVTTSSAQLINVAPTGWSLVLASTAGTTEMLIGLTGYMALFTSLVNNRGVEGPIWPATVVAAGTAAGATAAAFGGTYVNVNAQIHVPVWYGVSAINLYSYWSAATLSIRGTTIWNVPFVFRGSVPAIPMGSTSITTVFFGTSLGGIDDWTNNIGPGPQNPEYIALGASINTNFGGAAAVSFNSYSPSLLEICQNRMFLAGFSSTPSMVWFSDVGEPEGFQADWNFEVRTNDGDVVSSLKAYGTELYVFKKNSFHVLSGNNPDNFFLREITDQYGCINNNCVVTSKNSMFFLDQKGVVMWNGAQIDIISDRIQPIFDSMNYTAAVSSACMVHDKLRNQILVAIPTGESTTNNVTVIYDYMVGAWTTYKGFSPSIFAAIKGRNNTKNAFFGDTSGRVNWFGPSFLADNGVGFTTYIKTRFLHDMGDSTQKVFRRLFLNTNSPASSTLSFNINFFQDYGSSIVLGTSLVLDQFQSRLEYGISAKSVAFELSNLQTAIPLTIYGFTIESRFQRRV